jgi:hypothetical protein
MTVFNLGQVATLHYELKVSGALTDATVVLTVTAPDGTVSTPTVVHVSLGTYKANVLASQVGIWHYRWVASGVATDAEPGSFDVGLVRYAVQADVEAFFRPLTEAEAATIDRKLEYAANLLDQAVPSLPGRLAQGLVSPALVRDVVANMVVRALRNPEGAKQKSQTIGPASVSVTMDDKNGLGALMVTASDIAALSPARTHGQVGSIRLGRAL